MRAWIEVDLDALVRNGRTVMSRAGVPLLPMIKADAYGLGAVPIARALEVLDPWGFGVATVEEGAALRDAGIERPILLFTPILSDEIAVAHGAELTPTLADPRVITAWVRGTDNASWHLAIDTGMSRSGVRWDAIGALAPYLLDSPPAGACTHLMATSLSDPSIEHQLARFTGALDTLPARPALLHAENSLGIERLGRPSIWSLVRPGIFLYGGASGSATDGARAGPDKRDVAAPDPVVAMRARIVEMRTIQPGDTVSYGGIFRADQERRIATVAVGYGDGYRRAFSSTGQALLRGHRIPVVGVVTMDMTMFDVTGIACDVGDVVTLLGSEPANASHPAAQSVDLDLAARGAGLLSYELLTGLRMRLPRVYVGPHAG